MKRTILFIAFVVITAFSCKERVKTDVVTVSIVPQKYFVKKIAKDTFSVNVMIPEGASPATYEATPKQMKDLSQSKAYIRIGYVPFELAWMDRIKEANEDMLIVNSFEGVSLIKGAHKHSHASDEHEGHEHEKGTGSVDPHIWLSTKEVKVQAKNILEALIKIKPEKAHFFKQNYASFISEINEIDKIIRSALKDAKTRKFMVYHPALSYFARDYNLTQIAIEVEGKSPKAKDLKNFIDKAKEEKIRVILVQKEFDKRAAETIAKEIDGSVKEWGALSEDWGASMRMLAKTFSEIMDKK